MKYLLTSILMAAVLALHGQCYNTFREKSLQPPAVPTGYSILKAECQYNLYYVAYGYKSGNGYNVLYHLWNGTNWQTLKETSFTGGYPQLMLWNDRLIGFGRLKEVNKTMASSGRLFLFAEYTNGAWDTLQGGSASDTVYSYQKAWATRTGLYYLRQNDSGFYTRKGKGEFFIYDTLVKNLKRLAFYESYGGEPKILVGDKHFIVGSPVKLNNQNYYTYSMRVIGEKMFLQPYSLWGYLDLAIDGDNDHVHGIIGTGTNMAPAIIEFNEKDSIINMKKPAVDLPLSRLIAYKGILFKEDRNRSTPTYNFQCKEDIFWPDFYLNNSVDLTPLYPTRYGLFCQNLKTGKVIEQKSVVKMTGRAFVDMDGNCKFDPSKDSMIRRYPVNINGKGYFATAITNEYGEYNTVVPYDTFLISIKGSNLGCNLNKVIVDKDGIIYMDLPVEKPKTSDMNIRGAFLDRVRWNSISSYKVSMEYFGTEVDSAWYEMRIDPRLKLLPPYDQSVRSINNNVIKGQWGNLAYFDSKELIIHFMVDTLTLKVNDTVYNNFHGACYSNESDTGNNRLNFFQKIVYSFDPNHITCDKDSIDKAEGIRLVYKVDFQNEGSADAEDVIIYGTINFKLAEESFEFVSASNSCSIFIKDGLFRADFSNINLKPKTESDPLSKGYLIFALKTKGNLAEKDIITNAVSIQFDANSPVYTNNYLVYVRKAMNTSGSTVVLRNESLLQIYPNPSNNAIRVSGQLNGPLNIYDQMGRLQYTWSTVSGMNDHSIDIAAWPSGIYILQCGADMVKFVKAD